MQSCVVCSSKRINKFETKDLLSYWACSSCKAVFLDEQFRVDEKEEKERYLNHENDINDLRYREFLSRLSNPLKEKLKPDAKGLDFGCGPGPALADILMKEGYQVDLYDPFFYPNKEIFNKKYNFITCTETAEHFFNPKKEFDVVNSLLHKGGWFGVMTSFLPNELSFEDWYYRRDPTHVVFYSQKTFKVIAKQRSWLCEIIGKDVVLFNKK
jgi:hypothetical protein